MEADAQPGTDKFSQHNFTTIEAQMGSLQTKGWLQLLPTRSQEGLFPASS